MKNFGLKIIACVFLVVVLFFTAAVSLGYVHAESEEETYIPLIVTGSNLNVRMAPNKDSCILTSLEKGQEISGTGRWSKDHRWVEIYLLEYGKAWCSYQYLTERTDPFIVETLNDEPVKIRRQAFNGKVKGYLRKNRKLEITQVIYGWGKCKQGWIDLAYCIETYDE